MVGMVDYLLRDWAEGSILVRCLHKFKLFSKKEKYVWIKQLFWKQHGKIKKKDYIKLKMKLLCEYYIENV